MPMVTSARAFDATSLPTVASLCRKGRSERPRLPLRHVQTHFLRLARRRRAETAATSTGFVIPAPYADSILDASCYMRGSLLP